MISLLPIGTVVTLKESDQEYMIVGMGQELEGKEGVVYDYTAVPWPQGYLEADKCVLFNRDKIDKTLFTGYETELQQKISEEITKAIDEYRTEQNS